MSEIHLSAGSEMPPLVNKGKLLRVYSMALCPYAHRTRLVLAAKNIPHEIVNIDLQSKPEWYLKLNPAGQVPCLHFDDGRVLPESLINSEYLDQAYPENKLIPSDPFTNAEHKLLLERFSKIATNFYKLMRSSEAEKEAASNDLKTSLINDLEPKIPSKGYLGGEKPAFADYMIWPWLERLEVMKLTRGFTLNKTQSPNLVGYIERMKQLPAVKATFVKPEVHVKFLESYMTGKPDYSLLTKTI